MQREATYNKIRSFCVPRLILAQRTTTQYHKKTKQTSIISIQFGTSVHRQQGQSLSQAGWYRQPHLKTRLEVGVQEVGTVHIPDAPVGVVGRLPVLLGLDDQPLQLLLLVPLGLATRGQLWLHAAVWKHLVLHQHCTQHRRACYYLHMSFGWEHLACCYRKTWGLLVTVVRGLGWRDGRMQRLHDMRGACCMQGRSVGLA